MERPRGFNDPQLRPLAPLLVDGCREDGRRRFRASCRARVGAAQAAPTELEGHFFFLTMVKIPVPLVWVAIAVWSQLELLFVLVSQPLVLGPLGSN